MLGPSHLLLGATSYVAYATLLNPQPLTQVAIGAVVATATAHGVLSPDMDQRRPFLLLGDALGPAGRLVAHRIGVTHWWVLPVVAWVWWLPTLNAATVWAAAALIIGWASHIAGDAIFGRVPLLTPGWGPRVGCRIHTGGWVEKGGRWTFGLSPLRTALTVGLGWLLLHAAAIV